MIAQRRSRVILGVLVSAYGLYAAVRTARWVYSPLYHSFLASPPEIVRGAKWFPSLLARPWLGTSVTYLGFDWLCLAVLAVTGVGIAVGHKLSSRLALIALAVLIGAAVVIDLPGGIGLACGWFTIDYSRVNWPATSHALSEALKHPQAARLGHVLALLNVIGGIILKTAAFLWLRRETRRDAAAGDSAHGGQHPQPG
jgi:hypothetical protein